MYKKISISKSKQKTYLPYSQYYKKFLKLLKVEGDLDVNRFIHKMKYHISD